MGKIIKAEKWIDISLELLKRAAPERIVVKRTEALVVEANITIGAKELNKRWFERLEIECEIKKDLRGIFKRVFGRFSPVQPFFHCSAEEIGALYAALTKNPQLIRKITFCARVIKKLAENRCITRLFGHYFKVTAGDPLGRIHEERWFVPYDAIDQPFNVAERMSRWEALAEMLKSV